MKYPAHDIKTFLDLGIEYSLIENFIIWLIIYNIIFVHNFIIKIQNLEINIKWITNI